MRPYDEMVMGERAAVKATRERVLVGALAERERALDEYEAAARADERGRVAATLLDVAGREVTRLRVQAAEGGA